MSLVPRFILGDLDLTAYPFAVEWGTDFGAPQNVYEVVESIIVDGEDVRSPRSSNRTVRLSVIIEGPDLLELANAERSLLLECEKARNVLTIDPGDGFAEHGVFQTFRAQVTLVPSESMETANVRRYTVTFPALPFVRPTAPVTTTLTYGSDAGTSLDDGTSTTNWSSTAGAPSAVTFSGETAIKSSVTSATYVVLTRTSLALTAAKPYLAVDVWPNPLAFDGPVSVKLGSTSLGAPVAVQVLSTGFRRYFFAHSQAGTTQTVEITLRADWTPPNLPTFDAYIGNIRAYATAPGSGLMISDVEGSERAPMTVKVAKASAGAIGAFVIYSDPSMLEYGWNPGDSSTWPNAPAGAYVLLSPTAGSAGTMVSVTLNGQTSRCMGGLSNAMYFDFQFGARRDGRIGTITGTIPTNAMLFRDEPGVTSLVHIHNATGQYLFVDSPTIETPRIGVWSGSSSDGSDATSVLSSAESLDALTIKPPRYALFASSVPFGTLTDLTVTADYYPLSHTMVPLQGLVS